MCFSVHHVTIGRADALADLPARRLVLRPSLTAADMVAAARGVLEQCGVRQPMDLGAVACPCGVHLEVTRPSAVAV